MAQQNTENVENVFHDKQLFTYHCKCGFLFESKAQTRARCPKCKNSCSIKTIGKKSESTNEISDFEADFDNSIDTQDSGFIERAYVAKPSETEENTYEIHQMKYLKLEPSSFKDLFELFNAVAPDLKVQPISEPEVSPFFDTLNQFFRENQIFEGKGKIGILDIIMNVINLILPRFISALAAKFIAKTPFSAPAQAENQPISREEDNNA